MVEIIINGKSLELVKEAKGIKYTRQIADIFDLASVSASYTNSFSIPKTPNNTEILQFLGIIGDKSTIPYEKTSVTVKEFGIDIITNGWLNVTETSEAYKVSIIDGMIDFFKAIENKTLGVDLDLTNFTHIKNLENIVNSFSNEYYSYLVADYGGRTMSKAPLSSNFSIIVDYLVPSFSCKMLLELIFQTFGYTYQSARMDAFLTDLYITYPTPPIYEENALDRIATLTKNYYKSKKIKIEGDILTVPTERTWDEENVVSGQVLNNIKYVMPETTGYKVKLQVEAYVRYYSSMSGQQFRHAIALVLKNNVPILQFNTDPYNSVTQEIYISCQSGDVIEYLLYADKIATGSGIDIKIIHSFNHNKTILTVDKIDLGEVTPSKAFKDFKIKDFFKELLYRSGLIPVPKQNNLIEFIHISEMINFEKAVNWTNKYVQRKSEKYIKSNYAQINYFKMKYNEGEQSTNDGVLLVNNKNIESEKTLVQSIIYSPKEGNTRFRNSNNTYSTTAPILPMYDKEVNVLGDETLEVTYKELDSRFYFLRKRTEYDKSFRLRSVAIPESEIVDDLHFGTTDNTLLSQLVAENFSEYQRIFDNFRCHEIELAIGFDDFANLDLTVPYYFEQESAYYLLNKLPYQKGETTIGEFIKINE